VVVVVVASFALVDDRLASSFVEFVEIVAAVKRAMEMVPGISSDDLQAVYSLSEQVVAAFEAAAAVEVEIVVVVVEV